MSTDFEERLGHAMRERADRAPDVPDLAGRARAGHRSRRRRRLLVCAGGAVAATVLASSAMGWLAGTPTPAPLTTPTPSVTSQPTRTWTLPSGLEGDVAVMGGTWTGDLLADDAGCLFWRRETSGEIQNLRWPQGWTARWVGDGPVEVVNENGDVPYRSGTTITVEAWFSGARQDERCTGNQDVETTAIVVDWRGLDGQLEPTP